MTASLFWNPEIGFHAKNKIKMKGEFFYKQLDVGLKLLWFTLDFSMPSYSYYSNLAQSFEILSICFHFSTNSS